MEKSEKDYFNLFFNNERFFFTRTILYSLFFFHSVRGVTVLSFTQNVASHRFYNFNLKCRLFVFNFFVVFYLYCILYCNPSFCLSASLFVCPFVCVSTFLTVCFLIVNYLAPKDILFIFVSINVYMIYNSLSSAKLASVATFCFCPPPTRLFDLWIYFCVAGKKPELDWKLIGHSGKIVFTCKTTVSTSRPFSYNKSSRKINVSYVCSILEGSFLIAKKDTLDTCIFSYGK